VNDGQVILSRGEQAVNLGKGESGFSDGQLVRQLATTPGFMRNDRQLDNIEQNGGGGGGGGPCAILPM
ncbi:MAG: hypothetical protein PHF20_00295, partial [Halothiobacillaceae bacterium]|nr:hypothetical protein [Halothiobacillaceae bacterium]